MNLLERVVLAVACAATLGTLAMHWTTRDGRRVLLNTIIQTEAKANRLPPHHWATFKWFHKSTRSLGCLEPETVTPSTPLKGWLILAATHPTVVHQNSGPVTGDTVTACIRAIRNRHSDLDWIDDSAEVIALFIRGLLMYPGPHGPLAYQAGLSPAEYERQRVSRANLGVVLAALIGLGVIPQEPSPDVHSILLTGI